MQIPIQEYKRFSNTLLHCEFENEKFKLNFALSFLNISSEPYIDTFLSCGKTLLFPHFPPALFSAYKMHIDSFSSGVWFVVISGEYEN